MPRYVWKKQSLEYSAWQIQEWLWLLLRLPLENRPIVKFIYVNLQIRRSHVKKAFNALFLFIFDFFILFNNMLVNPCLNFHWQNNNLLNPLELILSIKIWQARSTYIILEIVDIIFFLLFIKCVQTGLAQVTALLLISV